MQHACHGGLYGRFALAALIMLLATIPATADAIDGNWCHRMGVVS
jgi:hypothetical protein